MLGRAEKQQQIGIMILYDQHDDDFNDDHDHAELTDRRTCFSAARSIAILTLNLPRSVLRPPVIYNFCTEGSTELPPFYSIEYIVSERSVQHFLPTQRDVQRLNLATMARERTKL